MYRVLEQKALDPKTNGSETAKCCEVAANIAIDVLRLEAEGIKAVKNGLVSITSATAHKNAFKNLRNSKDYDDYDRLDNNTTENDYNLQIEEDDDCKF